MPSLTTTTDEHLEAYGFELEPDRIAQLPTDRRDASRLLVVDREQGAVQHLQFADLPGLLQAGDLVVANDTRVLPARIHGIKEQTGGRVEILALHPVPEGEGWVALVKPSARVKPGTRVLLQRRPGLGLSTNGVGDATHTDVVIGEQLEGGLRRIDGLSSEILQSLGEMPLPPYIDRSAGPVAADHERYQTVYAREDGAVAAPTAGLHFTPGILEELTAGGVGLEYLTLHVGAGTFQPVRSERITEHPMHAERFRVPSGLASAVQACSDRGGRLLAVGTTTCRSLETWHRLARPDDGLVRSSQLFLHPGNPAQLQMSLLTNFHLPKSTLLMLVSSFLGRERTLRVYSEALEKGYRFYSYGDAMLIL